MSKNKRVFQCTQIDRYAKLVRLILDGECSQVEQSNVVQHINNCPECFEQYEIERHIRFLLKTKLNKKIIPTNFASRIRDSIFSNNK